ncbi:MAG: 5-(carboxyamino)imidazole ribonucleotide mutase [Deltaproteobacteria bacterium]|nr:5-(carboxyamino)imidazole ribonucleotide mutase [Deltaproteobacteria bacterium]
MNEMDVLIVAGSENDLPYLKPAIEVFDHFGLVYRAFAVSAHRTPADLDPLIEEAHQAGVRAILAAAGHAAHLPGVIAAKTLLPVVGVPVPSSVLKGIDSLLSIVQMPGGIPVAAMAIGEPGAKNGALFIVRFLALTSDPLKKKLEVYRKSMAEKVREGQFGYKPKK